jgi:predicted dehydrogenase
MAGVGFWGASWLGVVSRSADWELAGLVDNDADALERGATAAGIARAACFGSIDAAAEAVEADAVLVAVPPAAHAPLALEALDAGLHCLIEKPFASTLADARRIVERADAAGRTVMVSQQYRHRPGARTVQRLVATGAIGRVGAVSVRFANVLAVDGFQHEMEEPLLWDVAIHHFDLVRGVLDLEPATVVAATFNPSWSRFAGNAAANVVFATEDGVAITYNGTLEPRGLMTGWDGVWEILGDDGAIRWDGDRVVLRPLALPLRARIERRALKREWEGRRVKPVRVQTADRAGTLAELAAAIRAGKQPETSGSDNIRSLALVLAAAESARLAMPVDVRTLLAA